MQQIYLPKLIAWIATVLCVIASARGATMFANNNPRVFTILALFSLNWALLIPYYSESAPSEIIAGFAGFLLVYVGILLRREARERLKSQDDSLTTSTADHRRERIDAVGPEDRIALWILRLLIVPSVISLPFPTSGDSVLNRSVTEPLVGSLITLLGYYSVWSAVQIYSTNKKGKLVLSLVIIPYALVDFVFSIWLITHRSSGCPPCPPCPACPVDFWRDPKTGMPAPFTISFAILKMLFTAIFIYLVLNKSLSNEDRKLTKFEKFLKFVGI